MLSEKLPMRGSPCADLQWLPGHGMWRAGKIAMKRNGGGVCLRKTRTTRPQKAQPSRDVQIRHSLLV